MRCPRTELGVLTCNPAISGLSLGIPAPSRLFFDFSVEFIFMLSWSCNVLDVTCSGGCLVVDSYAKGEVQIFGINDALLTKKEEC